MKLSDFILLNPNEKKLTVLHNGVLVAKRNLHHQMIFLFVVDDYYVEAYCNAENRNIEEYRIYDNIDALSIYIDAIPINDLLN